MYFEYLNRLKPVTAARYSTSLLLLAREGSVHL
jgi:hypothetical protein